MTGWVVLSTSARTTMSLGRSLAKLVTGGEIIGLRGELGTGKTTFVRGFCEGIEVSQKAWIRSPSFTLINEYQGRLPVYHIDLYRVEGRAQLEGLNLREYLYSDGVSLIEWFEHLAADDVEEFLEVRIAYVDSARRKLTFTPYGERYEKIIEGLRAKNISP